MSTENLNKFQALLAEDSELRARVASTHQAAARDIAEKIAALAAENGTPFTTDEFLAKVNLDVEELSDEQLETVAGGFGASGYGPVPTEAKVLISIVSFGFACAVIAIDSKAAGGKPAHCMF